MIRRPAHLNPYEFAVLSSLRAHQLISGCVPRVAVAEHKATTIAQLEVAMGEITRELPVEPD